MNLKERVSDYITAMGIPQAAEKFGKKESTVKTWLVGKAFPIYVVEAALEGEGLPAAPEQVTYDPEPSAEYEAFYEAFQRVEERLNNHEARIQNIETFLQAQQQPRQLPVAQPPRVITPQPVAADVSPQFTAVRTLGGDPNNPPVAQPKLPEPMGVGAQMKTLLRPYDYSRRGR